MRPSPNHGTQRLPNDDDELKHCRRNATEFCQLSFHPRSYDEAYLYSQSNIGLLEFFYYRSNQMIKNFNLNLDQINICKMRQSRMLLEFDRYATPSQFDICQQ